MKAGKLDWDDLESIISESRSVNRKDVKVKNGVGEDCSVIDFGNYDCVVSTDPITGSGSNVGKLAVNINCNDIASCGVEPLGILVTILAPVGTELSEIKEVMQEISCETKKLNVEILGGHTEVTAAVNKLVISCTVIGKTPTGGAVATSGAKFGDDIIITKKLCLEGTSIIVNDYYDKVKSFMSEKEIHEAQSYSNYISVVKEGLICGKFGVNSMHDITEGGVLGALWEVAKASNLGFIVHQDKMPISDITKKLCENIGINPLKLISSGSMLVTTSKGEKLIKILKDNGIDAVIIGKMTDKDGILVSRSKEEVVPPPERDELFNISI